MKLLRCVTTWIGLILAAPVSESTVNAQITNGDPAVRLLRSSIQTVGSISYIVLEEQVWTCYTTLLAPVVRSGTNLSQLIVPIRTGVFCIACECPHFEQAVGVIGHLPPGEFSLTISLGPTFFSAVPITNLLFHVGRDTGATLHIVRTNSFFLQDYASMEVQGVPGAAYQLEKRSPDFKWTVVCTHLGAPFTYSEPINSSSAAQFYRVSIYPHVETGSWSPGPIIQSPSLLPPSRVEPK